MGKRLLVIEDEQNIIDALGFMFGRSGWSVVRHSNGNDALAVVYGNMPDVLILDVMLPGRSGYEILTDIRTDPKLQKLPVLILTARGGEDEQQKAMGHGATAFMTKPFSNKELIETVETLYRQDSNE